MVTLFFGFESTLLFAQSKDKDKEEFTFGAIADTSAHQLIDEKELLEAKHGVHEKFVKRGGSFVIDLSDTDIQSVKGEIIVDLSREGVVGRYESIPNTPLSRRAYVSDKSGYTDVLVSRAVKDDEGRVSRGDLLKVYRVTVTEEDVIQLVQELDALIGDVEGVDLRVVGSEVIVDGKVLVPKDMRRVLTVVRKYQQDKKPVLNLVEISPRSLELLAAKMEEEIAGGPDMPRNIKVKVVNGRFFLEGLVDKTIDRDIAVKTCQSFVQEQYQLTTPGVASPSFNGLGECVLLVRIRSGPPLDPDPIINVRVDYVTVTRDYLKNFNFRWSPRALPGNNSATLSSDGGLVSSFTAIFRDLFPQLRTASRHGHARILKSATLMVRDGEDASQGGGSPPRAIMRETLRIPITIPGQGDNPPQQQERTVQTNLSILAKSVPGTDKVNMEITTQQEELQGDNPENAPILSNFVQTSIVVDNGESAALGGLIVERRNVGVERDPGTEGFTLFNIGRGISFTDRKEQFVVFVTPQKLRSPTEGTESLKRKFRLRK